MTNNETKQLKSSLSIIDGVKDSIPISFGYIPVAITFGLLAKSYDIPNIIIVMMSAVIYAGSSQFMGIKLISLGTPYPEIILTTFMINIRNLLISSAMSIKTEEDLSKNKRAIIGYTVTDETFAILSSIDEEKVGFSYLLGLQGFLFISFNIGTFLGVYVVSSINPELMNSLGISIYAMFISILLPSIKKSRKIALICLVSIAISICITYIPFKISTGWVMIVTALVASSIGGYLHTKEVNKDE